MSTSKLLIDEDPILILPSLAVLIGLNESVFVQQLHYWTRIAEKTNSGKVVNGRRWVYKTLAEWRAENFPFWSERTIQTIVSNLRRIGAIDAEPLANDSRDRTNFYAINYAWLRAHDAESASSDDEEVASCSAQKLRPPNKTETTSETTTEIKPSTRRNAKVKPEKTLMPEDFGISEAVRAWANLKGHAHLEKHLEHFRLAAKAKSYVYADWDAAFMNAIRGDWAKVGAQSASGGNLRLSFAQQRQQAEIAAFVNDSPAADPNVIEMEVVHARIR